MKLFVIAVCIFAVVTADVSHLTGDGYHYDKPSVVFDVPQHVTVTQSLHNAPASLPVHHQEHSQVIQSSSSSGYLPPQLQYSPSPKHHQEISHHQFSQPISMSHQEISQPFSVSHQDISHSVQEPSSKYLPSQPIIPQPQYSVPASTPHQYHDISQHINVPSNEYLSPQIQQSLPALAPVHHQEISQHNTHTQPQYSGPAPAHHHEISQTIVQPSNDYLPPQSQHFVSSVTPVHQQEISQHVSVSQPQYSAPALAPIQHQQIAQPVSAPVSEYLPPQQKFTVPVQTPADHHEHSLTISAPSSDYLPPQQQYSVPVTAQHQQHSQEHEHHHESQSVFDGYHYDAPAKSFHF